MRNGHPLYLLLLEEEARNTGKSVQEVITDDVRRVNNPTLEELKENARLSSETLFHRPNDLVKAKEPATEKD